MKKLMILGVLLVSFFSVQAVFAECFQNDQTSPFAMTFCFENGVATYYVLGNPVYETQYQATDVEIKGTLLITKTWTLLMVNGMAYPIVINPLEGIKAPND